MQNKIIYIVSNDRSGSTVLDFLLGQHPDIISIGELHHLYKYLVCNEEYLKDTLLKCTCGKRVNECEFWSMVQKELGTNLKKFPINLNHAYNLKERFSINMLTNYQQIKILKNKFISRLVKTNPKILNSRLLYFLSGYNHIARNNFKLLDVICSVSAKKIIVDSSKTPHRLKYLFQYSPDQVFIVHLARNPVGVIYSMMKRKYDIDKAISICLPITG